MEILASAKRLSCLDALNEYMLTRETVEYSLEVSNCMNLILQTKSISQIFIMGIEFQNSLNYMKI